jgi:6-phosphogluconolactonase (cycloisomerase 2 family)
LASHYSNPNLLYGINELSGYVNTYFVNEDGTLKLADSIVSNPNRPWTNEDTGAAIVVSKNG